MEFGLGFWSSAGLPFRHALDLADQALAQLITAACARRCVECPTDSCPASAPAGVVARSPGSIRSRPFRSTPMLLQPHAIDPRAAICCLADHRRTRHHSAHRPVAVRAAAPRKRKRCCSSLEHFWACNTRPGGAVSSGDPAPTRRACALKRIRGHRVLLGGRARLHPPRLGCLSGRRHLSGRSGRWIRTCRGAAQRGLWALPWLRVVFDAEEADHAQVAVSLPRRGP